MQERCMIVIDEGFQREAKLAAIPQQELVMMRDARRPWIEIKVGIDIESADLR
jgi:hypothetical protein